MQHTNNHIQLVKTLLEKSGASIYKHSDAMIWAFTENNRKKLISFVCTFLDGNLDLSISFGGKANLEKSQKLANKIFGKSFFIEHRPNPVDGISSNYFTLKLIN